MKPGVVVREAWTSLWSHPLRAVLMLLGVAVGVGALAAVVSIGEGTRERILGLVAKHGLDMIMVRPGGEKQVFAANADRRVVSLSEEDALSIEASVPNVRLAAAVQNQRGLETVFGDRSVTTRIFGVAPAWTEIRRRVIERGKGVSSEDMAHQARICVLGAATARTLFGDQDPIGQTVRIAGDAFRVKGVFQEVGAAASAGEDWDDRIIIPFTTSSRRLFKRPHLEQIVVQVRDPKRLPETAERVRAHLRERHGIRSGAEDDFFVREPKDVKEAALETSDTLTRLLVGISVSALLAGTIVIMNVMLLSVSQRTREIGLRRAVGARRGEIALQLFVEATLICLLGGAAGIAAGLIAARLRPDSIVTVLPFAVSFGACTAVAIASGLMPARRAMRIDPAEALRDAR